MLFTSKFHFKDILIAISNVLDLASPRLALHQQRVAYIGWKMAEAANLPLHKVEKIFVAALLHDIGALTPEEKLALHEYEDINPEKHVTLGGFLFDQLPLLQSSANIVRNHHKKWLEYDESIDAPDVLESQILCLADVVERLIDRDMYILFQEDDIRSRISALAGNMFHPDVVKCFLAVSHQERFWLDMTSPMLPDLLRNDGPFHSVEMYDKDILEVSRFFRMIIDFRSHFTATHSSGVATCAAMLSKLFNNPEKDVMLMEVSGNLHDIGKFAVPNAILEKQDKLTKKEFAIVRQHTYHTYMVLKHVRGFEGIVECASFHHEKLDGTGYPFRVSGDAISNNARIMSVADVFTALTEDRPYRRGMSMESVIEILHKMGNQRHLDGRFVDLLIDNYENIWHEVQKEQQSARSLYLSRFESLAGETPRHLQVV